ncbi:MULTISPECIES: hypothetical protein [unclassified Pseudomonas]|jgi:hypothetical protein|uniref:hypothetical protein n=1 Tax=unclassified Pseudomonas TaxID=196821 RepID=UPI002113BD3E|nr:MULTISPECIES: hypothetical protein [unclassified Pseudomonas]
MAKQTINLGTAPTGVGGDTPRSAFTKTQSNFDELYAADTANYKRANILGAVSQASGVPTGAIIERSSNANGEFVKFADGTLICTRFVSGNMALTSPYGSGFYNPVPLPWTFPAAFVGTVPAVSATCNISTRIILMSLSPGETLTSCSFYLLDMQGSVSANANLRYLAVGRWF